MTVIERDVFDRPPPDEPDIVDLHRETLRSRLLTPDQLDRLPPPEPLVEGILIRNTLAAIYGKPGSGKSFAGLDIALCVATGTWWFGRSVHRGGVVYIAAEGSAGLPQRKRAWEQARHVLVTDGIHWLPMAVNLLDAEWSQALVQLVAELQPVLVIIDTVARSMVGGDENAPKDMGRLVDNADRIRLASRATVFLVHHSPKEGESLRGHSSLEGAVDTALEVKGDGSSVVIRSTKQKDIVKADPIYLRLAAVGDSAALYCHSGAPDEGDLAKSEAALLEAVMGAAGSDGLSTTALLKVSELPDTTFYRARKTLLRRGLIINVGTGKAPRYTTPEEGNYQ